MVAAGVAVAVGDSRSAAAEEEEERYEPIEDDRRGFVFEKPSANWTLTSKAGADLLYERDDIKSTTVGVVVQPVTVSSLESFGTLESVTDRVINTEKQKDGFYDITLLESSASSRGGGEHVTFYTVAYDVSTSRGDKRVISCVTINKKKLYILNIQAKPAKYDTDGWRREQQVLRHIEETFDVF